MSPNEKESRRSGSNMGEIIGSGAPVSIEQEIKDQLLTNRERQTASEKQ